MTYPADEGAQKRAARDARASGEVSLALYRWDPAAKTCPPLLISTGRWIHPLFEVESYLAAEGVKGAMYMLYDAVVGLAAAYMAVYMAIPMVVAGVASRPAVELLRRYRVMCAPQRVVEGIDCRSERLLRLENGVSVAHAYRVLSALRAAATARPANPNRPAGHDSAILPL